MHGMRNVEKKKKIISLRIMIQRLIEGIFNFHDTRRRGEATGEQKKMK